MATTSSSPRGLGVLIIEDEASGELLRVPLLGQDEWRESLMVFGGGCVAEDGHYRFWLQTDLEPDPASVRLTVNDEEVCRGLSGEKIELPAGPAGDDTDGSGTDTTTGGTALGLSPVGQAGSAPFALIFGFARAELSFSTGSLGHLASTEDIPVLVKGDRKVEEERISLMFSALFDGADDGALGWMLTGTPSQNERFSIVEGSFAAASPKGVSTFLQLSERVLAGFEELAAAFRQHAANKVGRSVSRIARRRVTRIGVRETLWMARNPEALERVAHPTPITDGRRSYLPRYVETERRSKTFDIYENQVVLSFLDHVARRLFRLSSMLEDHAEHERQVLRALGVYSRDEYVLSSLLVSSVSSRRTAQMRAAIDALAERATRLHATYRRAAPDAELVPFRPPKRSKIFQEVYPYPRLYQLMQMWCTFGDVDLSGQNLALRTERMDTFYEYYVLHQMLTWLRDEGFSPDEDADVPVSCVQYTDRGQYERSGRQVANRYLLRRGETRLALFYQPVFFAGPEEEHGVTIHRTTASASGSGVPYTPDYLIRVSDGGKPWTDIVIDAKYRHVSNVLRTPFSAAQTGNAGMYLTTMLDCLRKYKLECFASDTGMPPRAVWLLCGRDSNPSLTRYERSAWASAASGSGGSGSSKGGTGAGTGNDTGNGGWFIPSGAATVSPLANEMGNVLSIIGIPPAEESLATDPAKMPARTKVPAREIPAAPTTPVAPEAPSAPTTPVAAAQMSTIPDTIPEAAEGPIEVHEAPEAASEAPATAPSTQDAPVAPEAPVTPTTPEVLLTEASGEDAKESRVPDAIEDETPLEQKVTAPEAPTPDAPKPGKKEGHKGKGKDSDKAAEKDKTKGKDKPKEKPKTKPKEKQKKSLPGGANTADIIKMYERIAELLPDGIPAMSDSAWCQGNFGTGGPLLRESVSGNRDARKYKPATIGDEQVLCLTQLLPPQVNRLKRFVEMIEKDAAEAADQQSQEPPL